MGRDKQIAIRLPEDCWARLNLVCGRQGVSYTGLYNGMVACLRELDDLELAGELTGPLATVYRAGLSVARPLDAENRRRRGEPPRRKTQVRLAPEVNEWLDGFCARQGVTKNTLMIVMLVDWPKGWQGSDKAAVEAGVDLWHRIISASRRHDGRGRPTGH